MFGALAEFERTLIRERTMAGLQAAHSRGRRGRRPPAVDEKKRKLAVKLYYEKEHAISEILEMVGISRSTLYKYVRDSGSKAPVQ